MADIDDGQQLRLHLVPRPLELRAPAAGRRATDRQRGHHADDARPQGNRGARYWLTPQGYAALGHEPQADRRRGRERRVAGERP